MTAIMAKLNAATAMSSSEKAKLLSNQISEYEKQILDYIGEIAAQIQNGLPIKLHHTNKLNSMLQVTNSNGKDFTYPELLGHFQSLDETESKDFIDRYKSFLQILQDLESEQLISNPTFWLNRNKPSS